MSGASSDAAGMVKRWSTWVDLPGIGSVDPDRLLMVVGVVLLQLVTGNQLVRVGAWLSRGGEARLAAAAV